MEEDIKTKWKCTVCTKILASKQSATKHVKAFHSESDPKQTILAVKTSTSDGQSNPVKKLKRKPMVTFPSFLTSSTITIWLRDFPGARTPGKMKKTLLWYQVGQQEQAL